MSEELDPITGLTEKDSSNKEYNDAFQNLGKKNRRPSLSARKSFISGQSGMLKDIHSQIDEYGSDDLGSDFGPVIIDPYGKDYIPERLEKLKLKHEAKLADDQGIIGEFGAALAQSAAEIVGGTIEGFGYLGDLENWYDILTGKEADWQNWLSDMGSGVKQWVRDVAPVHQNPLRPDTSEWLFAGIPTIASWASVAIPATGFVGALGKIGKAAKTAATVGKVASTGSKATKAMKLAKTIGLGEQRLKGLTTASVSRHIENIMEANGVQQEQYQKLLASGMNEAQAKHEADLAAMNVYKKNWALVLQDIPQYMLLGKRMRASRGPVTAAQAKALGESASKVRTTGFLKGTGVSLSEGLEEAYQYIAGEEAKYVSDYDNGLVSKSDFADRFSEYLKSEELFDSMFFGSLGGATMTFAGKYMGKAGDKLNDIFSSRETREANQKERAKRDKDYTVEEHKNRGAKLAHLSQQLKDAEERGDELGYERIRSEGFTEMVTNAAQYGNFDRMISELQELKNSTPEQLAKTGTEESFVENIDSMIEEAYKIEKLWNKTARKVHPNYLKRTVEYKHQLDNLLKQRPEYEKAVADAKAASPFMELLTPRGQETLDIVYNIKAAERVIAGNKWILENKKDLEEFEKIALTGQLQRHEQILEKLKEEEKNISETSEIQLSERDREILEMVDSNSELDDVIFSKARLAWVDRSIDQSVRRLSMMKDKEYQKKVDKLKKEKKNEDSNVSELRNLYRDLSIGGEITEDNSIKENTLLENKTILRQAEEKFNNLSDKNKERFAPVIEEMKNIISEKRSFAQKANRAIIEEKKKRRKLAANKGKLTKELNQLEKDKNNALSKLGSKAKRIQKLKDKLAELDAKEEAERADLEDLLESQKETIYDSEQSFNDEIDRIIQERLDIAGNIEIDIYDDLTNAIVRVTERAERGIPVDPNSLIEAINYFHNKYKELTSLKSPANKNKRIASGLLTENLKESQDEIEKLLNHLINYENAYKSGESLPVFNNKGEAESFEATETKKKRSSFGTTRTQEKITKKYAEKRNNLQEKITEEESKSTEEEDFKRQKVIERYDSRKEEIVQLKTLLEQGIVEALPNNTYRYNNRNYKNKTSLISAIHRNIEREAKENIETAIYENPPIGGVEVDVNPTNENEVLVKPFVDPIQAELDAEETKSATATIGSMSLAERAALAKDLGLNEDVEDAEKVPSVTPGIGGMSLAERAAMAKKLNLNDEGAPTEKEEIEEHTIEYTPKGKKRQTYTIVGSKIFNSEGKEVFKEDSVDRNKIFVNLKLSLGNAVLVDRKNLDSGELRRYAVNKKGTIISLSTGKIMKWDPKHPIAIAVRKQAKFAFDKKESDKPLKEQKTYAKMKVHSPSKNIVELSINELEPSEFDMNKPTFDENGNVIYQSQGGPKPNLNLLSDPNIGDGTEIIIKVGTNDWWEDVKHTYEGEDIIKKIPMFAYIKNPSSNEFEPIGRLKGELTDARRFIYENRGKTIKAKIKSQKINSNPYSKNANDIRNRTDENGKPVFQSVFDAFKTSWQRSKDGFELVKNNAIIDVISTQGNRATEKNQQLDTSRLPSKDAEYLNKVDLERDEKSLDGQIFISVINPSGITIPLKVSTSNLNQEAIEFVYDKIIEGQFEDAQEIIYSEYDDIGAHIRNKDGKVIGIRKEFIQLKTNINSGEKYLKFAIGNNIVSVQFKDIKNLLPGEMIAAEIEHLNGKGKLSKQAEIIEINFEEEMMKFLQNKKYNVQNNNLRRKGSYTSPITRQEYNSYEDYLTGANDKNGQPNNEAFDESRPERVGSILQSDVWGDNGNFFWNVNADMEISEAVEENITKEEQESVTLTDPQEIWDEALEAIKNTIEAPAFKTWFEPTKAVSFEDGALTVELPHQLFYEWLEEHYSELIKNSLSGIKNLKKLKFNYPTLEGQAPSFKKAQTKSDDLFAGDVTPQEETLNKLNTIITEGKDFKTVTNNKGESVYGNKLTKEVKDENGKVIKKGGELTEESDQLERQSNVVARITGKEEPSEDGKIRMSAGAALGNVLDDMGRDVFDGIIDKAIGDYVTEADNEDNNFDIEVDDAVLTKGRDLMKPIVTELTARGIKLVSNDVFVKAEYTSEEEGKSGFSGIGGTLDLIGINEAGEAHIIDFKNTKDISDKKVFGPYSYATKISEWTNQQSTYGLLTENYGIPVASIEILSFSTTYEIISKPVKDKNGKVIKNGVMRVTDIQLSTDLLNVPAEHKSTLSDSLIKLNPSEEMRTEISNRILSSEESQMAEEIAVESDNVETFETEAGDWGDFNLDEFKQDNDISEDDVDEHGC